MTTDYKEISTYHEKRYGWDEKSRRIYKQLYSEKTHFIYELIQNAEDSNSQCLELQLYDKELLVWNDGSQFSKEDVKKICSLYSSNKDLTQIGSFGIGFKAVYNYTDLPEVYSGAERFLIDNLIKPKGIPKSDMNPNVAKLVENGKTVFRLPFKEGLHEEDINQLGKRLRELNVQTLLFLRNLKKVYWSDERKKQNCGVYHCTRQSHDIIQNAEEVKLTKSVNDNNQTTEKFLVFRKEICPPTDVINQLIHQEEDPEDKQRIERSAEKLQPVEVAFKIEDKRIIEMGSCVLFAYLPTQMKTNLRFLIQARYQTTPARDNISTNSPWNEWLMKETANFLPDVLGQLKAGDLLTPTFFNVLPLKDDKIPTEYEAISKSLQEAMQNRPVIPTQDDNHTIAKDVLYPHTKSLYHLVKGDWMGQYRWLDPEIRDTIELRRCYRAMEEAGVKKAPFSRVLKWLERLPPEWFMERTDDWLRSLYLYLNKQNKQKSEMKRVKELPLVRLENGSHICASKNPVFFAPNISEERENIAPFINELFIVQSSLLEKNDIINFLEDIGVKTPQPANLIREYILPNYLESDRQPTVEQNRGHIHYIRTVLLKKPTELSKLKVKIRDTPILLAYREGERRSLVLKKPCEVHLPEKYTGNTNLETYFSGYDNVWYVDDGYLDDNSDPKKWCSFLKEIGASDIPRVIKKNGESHLDGLQEALEKISNDKNETLSLALWNLLIKVQSSFNVMSCPYLKETAWVPDEDGKFHLLSECFAPTTENRELLGGSVHYLHPNFDISEDNETHRWLVEKLEVHLNANTDSVMNYLQTLSGSTVNIENIVQLYRFLAERSATSEQMQEKFKAESLIFTYDPEPQWWKADEVFWEDESHVFGHHRGYLKKNYADYEKTLEPFFHDLGITDCALSLDYIRVIQKVTSEDQADNPKVRKRVKTLYHSLWHSLQKSGKPLDDGKWEEIRTSKCWLGKKGDEWGFFSVETLVWNDNTYLAKIFDGTIPFWGLGDDLLGFAEDLGIERCSQAKVKFNPIGEQKKDPDWTVMVQNLHPYIHDFLNSPDLCVVVEKDKSVDDLKALSVHLVEELGTTYTLKTVSLTASDPRPSFLDKSDQKVTLWLEADNNDYPLLIGDALQNYFGVKELGRFIEHLLTKDKIKVIDHWKREGLQTELCESRIKPGGNDIPKSSQDSANGKVPGSTDENGTDSIIDNGDTDSSNGSNQHIHEPGNGSKSNTTKGNVHLTDVLPPSGSPGNRFDMPESQKHKELKEHLAANPSQLGAGLKLVEIEHTFISNDRVDILLKDSSGHPVPVEVEIHFPSTNQRDLGVWQAAKYQHLAAVEHGLQCNQVRSILVAPEIPDDVIEKCYELGIEPIEVPLTNNTKDSNAYKY